MLAPWVKEELKGVDLDDKRLNDRLAVVLAQLAARPTASIPAACGGHREMTAAYRLFDNDKATVDRILQPHIEATRRRIVSQRLVVLVQDTTEVDLTRPEQPVRGAGPLDGDTRRGALLHLLHAFTPDGTPLGTVHAMPWTRDEGVNCRSLTRAERGAIPIEDKESYRWITTIQKAQVVAKGCPETRCVCVCDSEADIYELFEACQVESQTVDWIVRACQNRALTAAAGSDSEKYLREQVAKTPVLFTHSIKIRGRKTKVACEARSRRQPRESREVAVSVRAASVTLRPPSRPGRKLPAVSVNAVLVHELNAPAGEEPVEWLLLTNLPIDDEELVQLTIQYYCTRWMIEVFFRVLKSGCRVEERRFEQIDRLLACLAVYLIVAWRTLYVCRLGRSCPDVSCEAVFEPAEWKAAWKVVHREDPPDEPPPLQMMVRLVAELGGYVPRKGTVPGPQTVWLGLQRTHDFALCWNLFGPAATKAPKFV